MNYYAIVKLNLVDGASEFILDALSLSKNKRILSFNSSLVNCELLEFGYEGESAFVFQLLIGKLRTKTSWIVSVPAVSGFNSSLVNCEQMEK